MSATPITPATKYRVAIRDIAVKNGWTFTQVSPSVDQFEKGKATISVTHGPSNLISTAERLEGKAHDVVPRAGKMFTVQEWLTGVADPNHERYIRLSNDQVAKYESGQGIAKLDVPLGTKLAKVEEKEPVKKPVAKRAPAKKATGPAPRPTARTASHAPAVKASA